MQESMEHTLGELRSGRISRRDAVVRLGAMVLALAGARDPVLAADGAGSSTFRAVGLNHLALRVTDVRRSRDFYRKHLGMTVVSEGESTCFLGCGENFVALFRSGSAGMHHYCYTVPDYDPARTVARLEEAKLKPERQENRVYFDDPDGLTVQLAGSDHWPA